MKKGFTLAEILIALGIVGIVAVLSIPSLMKNYKNRTYTAQLERTYSQIAGAINSVMADEHTDSFVETKAASATNSETSGVQYFLSNYLKTEKNGCQTGDDTCVSISNRFYRNVNGEYISGVSDNYCVQTVNGAAVCGFFNSSNHCMSLMVDVNGIDGPNIAGRDIFSMDVRKDGFISDYGSGCSEGSYGCAASSCTKGGTGNLYSAACGCLTSVIEAGWKMEY